MSEPIETFDEEITTMNDDATNVIMVDAPEENDPWLEVEADEDDDFEDEDDDDDEEDEDEDEYDEDDEDEN